MGADGTVIEINSNGSLGTSPENTPSKIEQQDSDDQQEFKDDGDEDNFGFLTFNDKELASSFGLAKHGEIARNKSRVPEMEPLSTRSETEEERALRFQIWLRQLQKMTST